MIHKLAPRRFIEDHDMECRLKIEKEGHAFGYAKADARDWEMLIQPGITVGAFFRYHVEHCYLE